MWNAFQIKDYDPLEFLGLQVEGSGGTGDSLFATGDWDCASCLIAAIFSLKAPVLCPNLFPKDPVKMALTIFLKIFVTFSASWFFVYNLDNMPENAAPVTRLNYCRHF